MSRLTLYILRIWFVVSQVAVEKCHKINETRENIYDKFKWSILKVKTLHHFIVEHKDTHTHTHILLWLDLYESLNMLSDSRFYCSFTLILVLFIIFCLFVCCCFGSHRIFFDVHQMWILTLVFLFCLLSNCGA